ncbi:MAG: cupin domain-containing protein [Dehalococcoidia bacterium]|nr:MAG: cupin domain-containing protein [Dehalococcoidia bacterium]
MPKTSKKSASQVEKMEGFEGHYEDLGGYTAGFETYTADADLTPVFAGLPDDRCQSRHWGFVVKGKVTFHFPDHDETYETGDAYYAPPGHTPMLFAGTEVVEFSPSDELAQTMEVVTKNMQAAG